MSANPPNVFLTGSIPRTFARTALPIVLLTSLNGVLTVVDAILLGALVGPEAIAAVTLVFPISMLLIALATAVSTGMASILGRLLGAGRDADARRVFAGAHGIALCIGAASAAIFALVGWPLVNLAAGGSHSIATMGYHFLSISIFTSPALFLLSLHSDALRTEGRIGFMAVAGVCVALANVVLNYGFIVWLGLGVAGSAMGTAIAQLLALMLIVHYRVSGRARLTLSLKDLRDCRHGWGEILALGAPRSLTFIGISLAAAATIYALGTVGAAHFEQEVAAYGIVTRIVSLAFFPLLGMSLALQALVGNNAGAGLWQRSNDSLKLSLWASLAYSAVVEVVLIGFRHEVSRLFTADLEVLAAVDRIIPVFLALYFTFGPMMMIASYFQSLGDVRRSAILALSRTYLFALPMIFLLPGFMGEIGIWIASPVADVMLVIVAIVTLRGLSGQRRWGLFQPA
ncbi:MAG: MATE family efflux transporter [Devosia sp.]|nr:MATE family efflux transporter [Devosia sp.]